MQIFIPYPDIKRSVQCLDPSRLGNQIYRECLTLARGGWAHHPVAKMWKHHKAFLCEYAFAGLEELSYRGLHYPDSFDQFHEIYLKCLDTGPPPWWGDVKVHNSHKANLLRKDYSYYQKYNWQYEVSPADVYYYPEIDEKKELQRLQPIIRSKKRPSAVKVKIAK